MASTIRETPRQKSTSSTRRNRKTTVDAMRLPTHDEIALRARQLYEKSGYQGGREVEFWLEAERQLREEINASK